MNLKTISNAEVWNLIRKVNPKFASHTAEATAETFTERGWAAFTSGGEDLVQEFWEAAVPFYLNMVNVSRVRDVLYNKGFGESYEIPWGGYIQRMSVDSVKPLSPAYVDLVDGGTVDPFVIIKPKVGQRFFRPNFNYQAGITIPDMWQTKQMFVAEKGISEFLNAVYIGLENGYILQTYLNKLECLNHALNDTENPLQETQKVTVTLSDDPTETELANFILAVKNVITSMEVSAQSGAYNAGKFQTVQDKDRLKLLIRAGLKNLIDVRTLVGAFNPEYLSLGVDIIEVPNFGGLVPYAEATFTTQLYPAYNTLGQQIGYNTQPKQTEATYTEEQVFWKDPNESTIAILADKGLVFEMQRNPYTVKPIYNPRGLYTNAWASSPDNGCVYDSYHTMIQFTAEAPDAEAAAAVASSTVSTKATKATKARTVKTA